MWETSANVLCPPQHLLSGTSLPSWSHHLVKKRGCGHHVTHRMFCRPPGQCSQSASSASEIMHPPTPSAGRPSSSSRRILTLVESAQRFLSRRRGETTHHPCIITIIDDPGCLDRLLDIGCPVPPGRPAPYEWQHQTRPSGSLFCLHSPSFHGKLGPPSPAKRALSALLEVEGSQTWR